VRYPGNAGTRTSNSRVGDISPPNPEVRLAGNPRGRRWRGDWYRVHIRVARSGLFQNIARRHLSWRRSGLFRRLRQSETQLGFDRRENGKLRNEIANIDWLDNPMAVFPEGFGRSDCATNRADAAGANHRPAGAEAREKLWFLMAAHQPWFRNRTTAFCSSDSAEEVAAHKRIV